MLSDLKKPALFLTALMLSGVSTSRFDELGMPERPLPLKAGGDTKLSQDTFEAAMQRNPILALNTITNIVKAEQEWLRWHGKQERSHIYAGLPLSPKPLTVLTNIGYVAGFSEAQRQPLWVAFRLLKYGEPGEHKNVGARPSGFPADKRLRHPGHANALRNSGWDHGHMAPNYAIAACYGDEAQRETFLMSNVCPQKPALNRGAWRYLEELESNLYANAFEEVWVITGPVLDHNAAPAKNSDISVPRGFYRIQIDEDRGKLRTLSFYFEQSVGNTKDFKPFLRSIRDIEQMTGINFDEALPDVLETQLEQRVPSELWEVAR